MKPEEARAILDALDLLSEDEIDALKERGWDEDAYLWGVSHLVTASRSSQPPQGGLTVKSAKRRPWRP